MFLLLLKARFLLYTKVIFELLGVKKQFFFDSLSSACGFVIRFDPIFVSAAR